MKTCNLSGALLDLWVAKAEGADAKLIDVGLIVKFPRATQWVHFHPSTMWEHGGDIIEREGIAIWHGNGKWHGSSPDGNGAYPGNASYIDTQAFLSSEGPTPLIAAMRCYVAAKFGEEVAEVQT